MPAPTPDRSSGDATPAVLDAAALDRLRELDPGGRAGVLERVLRAYESSLTRLLAQLPALGELPADDTAARAQLRALGELAHTLKSSSASVGALSLAAVCEQVEHRARGGRPDPAAQRHDVTALDEQGQKVLSAVKAMLHP